MKTQKRFPKELRERAVRMVVDHSAEYSSEWQTISSIADKFGIAKETLRRWIRQFERDKGLRTGLTTTEREQLSELKRENQELRRANEILKSAAAFFGAELDRRQKT